MNIIFDSIKDAANLAKHGLSLADAANIEWETLRVKPDIRCNYGETRMIGYALIATRLYCVVFADRDQERRIISLRKANQREVNHYVSKN